MSTKISDKPSQRAIKVRLTRLADYLNKIEFLKWDPNKKEEFYEAQVYQYLSNTGKFVKQQTKQDIRVDVFGLKHKPDAIYHECIALEIKKVGSTASIQQALGQALCYLAHYSGVVLLLLDFTGKIKSSLNRKGTIEMLKDLDKMNIRVVVKDQNR